jgi:gamma-glutamyl-gamma-aminobutyrate hydrolase PuuD
VTVVGLTQRVVSAYDGREVRTALDLRWARFLDACGILGIPLPLDPELADATLARTDCAGIVLTGGEDLGEMSGTATPRDRLERHLLTNALEEGRPVIGVCRGMQLILRTFGARLLATGGHVATTHELTGEFGGRTVNSFHRWSAVEVPEELAVTARSGDIVESVRLHAAPVIGIMWHPERVYPFDPWDVGLFTQTFADSAPGRRAAPSLSETFGPLAGDR